MTPAEELRAAAAKLQALTKAIGAPDLPDQTWHTEACANEGTGDCPCIVAQGNYSWHDEPSKPLYYVADAETPECAAYIAAMHAGVGEKLARWLESWTGIDLYEAGPLPEDAHHALAVARAILGSQP